MNPSDQDEFERVIAEGVALQRQLPWLQMVAVGGTAAAVHARHRYSTDTDHVTPLLKDQFEVVRDEPCDWEGWVTKRVRRPFLILGERHGVDLGIRQQRRLVSLQTTRVEDLVVPTAEETLRIKAFLCTDRQAVRDFLDVAALADLLGPDRAVGALGFLNVLYAGEGNQSCVTRLAEVTMQGPVDRDRVDLREYKGIRSPYDDMAYVLERCQSLAKQVLLLEMQGGLATSLDEFMASSPVQAAGRGQNAAEPEVPGADAAAGPQATPEADRPSSRHDGRRR